ncbi:MAG: TlyA family RNA methyltransferase [Cyanobacteria bacterium P01_D01_bin.123]
MPRDRLDVWLVRRGYFDSRQQAQRSILAGEVQVDGEVIDKPGTAVVGEPGIQLKAKPAFVSRGGEKLAGALAYFDVEIADRICLDGGISTGGFTDCLLQREAEEVFGVDVGYGQVAWSLQTNPCVHVKERTNLRHLTPEQLYERERPVERWADLTVIDVSFISLTKILPAVWKLLRSPREALLLVKPQFEAGRDRVGKKGVVRDAAVHAEVLLHVARAAVELGWGYRDATWSPIVGPAGNIEYWLWLHEQGERALPALENFHELARSARTALTRTAET